MKAALITNLVTGDFEKNQKRILELADDAVKRGAGLVVFGEAAATGLINTGELEHDIKIAEPVPGPRNTEWGKFARDRGVYFAAGLIERDGRRMYDSALLYDPGGNLILHYRRNDPGWLHPGDDREVYRVGTEIRFTETPFGKVGFLVCGDLWSNEVVERFKAEIPRYLIYIMERTFNTSQDIHKDWESELEAYWQRLSITGCSVLAVNLLREGFISLGSAWYMDGKGKVHSLLPAGMEGALIVDLI